MKNTTKRALYIIAALLATLFVASCLIGFAACGGGNNNEDKATVSSVSISGGKSSMTVGDEATLTASVTMSDGGNYSGSYSWSTSDSNVVSLSATNTVSVTATAVAVGNATITLSVDNSKSATYAIAVSAAEEPTTVESVTISGTLDVAYNSSTKLTATVTMSDESDYDGNYTWTSSDADKKVIEVTSEGAISTVKGVSCGTATVTVAVDNNKTASCTVTVSEDHTAAEAGRVHDSASYSDAEKAYFVVTPAENETPALAFDGDSSVATYDSDTKTYTVSGQSAAFGVDLAKAFWGETASSAHEGCEYITFAINMNAGESAVATTYNGSTQEKDSWNLTSSTDNTFVVDLSDHTEGDWRMELVVTYAGGDEIPYTIVLGDIHDCATEGHELVGTYDSGTPGWTYTCSDCGETVELIGCAATDPKVASATLIATNKDSIQSAVAWSSTGDGANLADVDLTVKLDAEADAETGVPTIDMSNPSDLVTTAIPSNDAYGIVIGSYATGCPETDEANAVKLTLDLNGNTLVRNKPNNSGYSYDTIVVKDTGDLTIIDTSSDGSGVVDAIGLGNRAVCNLGTLTLKGGFFTRSNEKGMEETSNGTDSSYTIENFGTMTIEDGATVFNAGDYSTCVRSHANTNSNMQSSSTYQKPASLTMTGGKVYGGKYAVGNGSSGYDDEFIMTGGILGGLRSEDDTLPYRALNNYCNATITGGTLLGGNGGSITASATKADECVEGVVIFNEDTGSQALTIGDEYGNGPDIIYEGLNHDTDLRGTFATGIAVYSGEVDFKGGSIECTDTDAAKAYTFVGAYLTGGTLKVSGGSISGDEALEIDCAEGGSVAAEITGGALSGSIVAYAVAVDGVITNPLTFEAYATYGYTLTEQKKTDGTVTCYIYA